MSSNLDIGIVSSAYQGLTLNSPQQATLDKSGALVVIDFYAKAILDGHGYQVRAGTISVPLVGDVVITDTAAEYAVDCASGKVVIPVFQCISVNLGTGTLFELATKSVATASSAGTAFVPLPLKDLSGTAAVSTAPVSAPWGGKGTSEASPPPRGARA